MKTRIAAGAISIVCFCVAWVIFGALATEFEMRRIADAKPEVCRSEFGHRVECTE